MGAETSPQAITTAWMKSSGGQTTQTRWRSTPDSPASGVGYGVTHGMTDSYVYLVIILQSAPKEELKPHTRNRQCVRGHVS